MHISLNKKYEINKKRKKIVKKRNWKIEKLKNENTTFEIKLE